MSSFLIDRQGMQPAFTPDASVSDAPISDHRPQCPALPLVSVVIVNYNYGRFLRQAIESVFTQDYPRLECIVVDNGSSDESAEVIAAARACYPSLLVHARGDNAGQSLAAMEGLARTSGPYVIFLDADDYLLRHCVSTHVGVHLSSRVHVGFSCGDLLQIDVDNQVVLSTNEPMATYLLAEGGKRLHAEASANLLRPTQAALGSLWSTFDGSLARRVHLVPRSQKDWVWCPTSGTCFRRDALTLFADQDGLVDLKSQTDLYLAFGINAVAGSILIDEPVFAYRLHGSNVFSSKPQLQGFLTFDPKRTARQATLARRLLVAQLVSRIERFVQDQWLGFRFLKALRHVDVADCGKGGGSYAATMVARHFDAVQTAVGPRQAFFFLLMRGAPLRTLWRALQGKSTP